ncbi:MAG: hypothetical protein IPL33_01030 [Sphingobacteriales bacterium]|nr:hypothetical protein [Sphingobacteriales bacterium]
MVSIVHDCSPIRKPESRVLDGLGKVQSLDNTVVNGYNTFATIAVDVGGREVRLLACTPFSNGVDSYVSKEERKAYETGQIKDPQRRAAIAAMMLLARATTKKTSYLHKCAWFRRILNR